MTGLEESAMVGVGGGRGQLAAGGHEAFGGLGKFQPEERGARGEHKVETGRHEMLVLAVEGAEAAFGPVTVNGITHGGP